MLQYNKAVALVNLENDPAELFNVAVTHKEVGGRFLHILQEWRRNTGFAPIQRDKENEDKLRSLGYIR